MIANRSFPGLRERVVHSELLAPGGPGIRAGVIQLKSGSFPRMIMGSATKRVPLRYVGTFIFAVAVKFVLQVGKMGRHFIGPQDLLMSKEI